MIHLGITGHQALPSAAYAYARSTLHHIVSACPEPVVGVSSLAAGVDQLFARIVLQYGHHLHVVVPCARYAETFGDDDHAAYRRLLGRARVFEVLPFEEPSEEAFWIAGQRVVELSDRLYAVWDGAPARGKGGTAEVVQFARAQGVPTEVIWPEGVRR